MNLRPMRRLEKAIKHVQSLGTIYALGGGRGRGAGGIVNPSGPNLPWTDCSGAGYWALGILGIKPLHPGGWTGTMVLEGHEGTSPFFTVYVKEPQETEGHMIMRLRHHPRWRKLLGMPARFRWAECGGSDNPRSGGGLTYFKPTEARVAEFPFHRHWPELDRRIRGH